MMISETLLKKGRSISFPGFQVFRKDRATRGGEVAVLVRNKLEARQIELDLVLEVIGIEVEIGESRYRFILAYIPPRKIVTKDKERGLHVGPRTVIGGDFNSKNRVGDFGFIIMRGER